MLFQRPRVSFKVRLKLIPTVLEELVDKPAKGQRPNVTLLSLFAMELAWTAVLM